MATASDVAVLYELVREHPEFKRIGIVANALERWNVDPSIREVVRLHGRQSGVDVLDLLDVLPAKLGYDSPERFVCGYRAMGDSLTAEETAEFERWNALHRQALKVARQPAHADWMDLHEPVAALFASLAEFVGERYRLYGFVQEARSSRTS